MRTQGTHAVPVRAGPESSRSEAKPTKSRLAFRRPGFGRCLELALDPDGVAQPPTKPRASSTSFSSFSCPSIERYKPALWIHGHMHNPVDERVATTESSRTRPTTGTRTNEDSIQGSARKSTTHGDRRRTAEPACQEPGIAFRPTDTEGSRLTRLQARRTIPKHTRLVDQVPRTDAERRRPQ